MNSRPAGPPAHPMAKLRLDPEILRVESFAAADMAAARGTVGAHVTDHAGCSEVTCLGPDSGGPNCPVSWDVQLCRATGPETPCVD